MNTSQLHYHLYCNNQNSFLTLYLKYGQPCSPDQRSFTILLQCFYHTTSKPLTVLFSHD